MKMHLIPLAYSLLLACAYVPVTKPDLIQDKDCQMLSKELKLEEKKILSGGACSGAACAALVIVPAASFLISGSIVLVGNTLHWLEKNGTCSDGLVKQNFAGFMSWASRAGGEPISDK
jgi:hypothetical protein